MTYNEIDHDAVRARAEKRLEPRMRLLRRRALLFAHILIFITAMVLIYSSHRSASPFFYVESSYVEPARTWIDPMTNQPMTIAGQTYESFQPYASVVLLSWPLTVESARRRPRLSRRLGCSC